MWSRLPLLQQIKQEPRWNNDLLAGAITAILLVPQAMAYAMLAGLPPEVGLYASVIPPIAYALFGTSRALAVGPVAVAALMVASVLNHQFGANGPIEERLAGAMILAAEVGLFMLVLGACRLGLLVSFISHPVLSGFTTGAALLIVISQIPEILGVSVPQGNSVATLTQLFGAWSTIDAMTMAFGIGTVVVMLLARAPLHRALIGAGINQHHALLCSRLVPLAVVVAAVLISQSIRAYAQGVATVGTIPHGLPIPSLAFLTSSGWLALAPSALLIALVGYIESVSVAKALATRRRQKIDANQELVALGASNLAAATMGGMPVAGGFSRSVVNFDAGASTQRAAIFTAIVVGVVTLFFSSWFEQLPRAVLAAIIVVAVLQLVDIKAIKSTWVYDRADGFALVLTMLAVLALGIEQGLIAGISLSLGLYLWRTSQPHMAIVGKLAGTEHFRNINRHVVTTLQGVLIVRIDENLYFANVAAVENYLLNHVSNGSQTQHIVLVMSAVNYIDSSGLEMLERINDDLGKAGITLHLAEVKGPVMDRLGNAQLANQLQPNRIFLTTNQAWNHLSKDTNEC